MSSGSKDDGQDEAQEASTYTIPTVTYQTTGWGGQGLTETPLTNNAASKPAWMTGAWNMPEWGQNASATGNTPTAADANALIAQRLANKAATPAAAVTTPSASASLGNLASNPLSQAYAPGESGPLYQVSSDVIPNPYAQIAASQQTLANQYPSLLNQAQSYGWR